MAATLTEFTDTARIQGAMLEMGGSYVAKQEQSGPGAFAACNADTHLVRFATDTDVYINGYAADSKELVPAGSVEWFPAKGRTFTTTAVA